MLILSMRDFTPPDCLTMFSIRCKGRQSAELSSEEEVLHWTSLSSFIFSNSKKVSQHSYDASPSRIEQRSMMAFPAFSSKEGSRIPLLILLLLKGSILGIWED
eukprot:Gb_10199 [translate_table: standard]